MAVIGKIESLWRYPVKSMRGEGPVEIFISFAGVYGDRLFAFIGSRRPKAFPWLTGREQSKMVLYRPHFRYPDRAAKPPNWAEAEGAGPGLTPVGAQPADLSVNVETPSGEVFSIDDPLLIRMLEEGLGEPEGLTLLRSDRAMTDCRPVSLFSIQTAQRLGEELGASLDKRRFRANIFVDLYSTAGFAEDVLVGRTLRIGPRVKLAVVDRDSRCAMITIDPDTGERNTAILANLTKAHDGKAGVYGAVLVEGVVQVGDSIELLD
jgi:uncharacterized protein